MTDQRSRQQALHAWLASVLSSSDFRLTALAGDASFRRYLRLRQADGSTRVVMDAPPPQEDVRPFVLRAEELQQAGVRVPRILAQDEQRGFLLLEDFGDTTWAQALLREVDMSPLLEDALRQLHALQAISPAMLQHWPRFDIARIRRECALWTDWYLPRIANCPLSESERMRTLDALQTLFTPLSHLPQVAVHLDYHSRNLMLPDSGLPLGVIDFQDAVLGPLTYDLASLLYDCYQDYPEAMRRQWSLAFFQTLPAHHQAAFGDEAHWHRMLRLTALQRHFKAIGIFARLAHRDGKRQFLKEIPLTQKHMQQELSDFIHQLDDPDTRKLISNTL